MNKKSVIVFDFDGTIVDSNNLEHQALLNTIHEYGYEEIDDSNLEDHFGPAESGILKNILGEDIFNREVMVIRTDRGSEFTLGDETELREEGSCRTRIFYCDPHGQLAERLSRKHP
jgi:phosphoglycolate phosphatase-like HAD superfamily hydrolase